MGIKIPSLFSFFFLKYPSPSSSSPCPVSFVPSILLSLSLSNPRSKSRALGRTSGRSQFLYRLAFFLSLSPLVFLFLFLFNSYFFVFLSFYFAGASCWIIALAPSKVDFFFFGSFGVQVGDTYSLKAVLGRSTTSETQRGNRWTGAD